MFQVNLLIVTDNGGARKTWQGRKLDDEEIDEIIIC